MSLPFPSPEFDDAVAAVCHGELSETQAVALRETLLADARARDEYLHRVMLHAALASEPDLFAGADAAAGAPGETRRPLPFPSGPGEGESEARRRSGWGGRGWAVAAGLLLLAGAAAWWGWGQGLRREATSRAVAMLNRAVNARWEQEGRSPRLGAPLEPGTLRLASGLAQVVFYNGARVVLEGPAELQLVSPTEAACLRGTLTAEVPPPARGFRIRCPGLEVTDLGTAFGLKVGTNRSELHVFEGRVRVHARSGEPAQELAQGAGAVVEAGTAPRAIAADPAGFAGLFALQSESVAAEARRYGQWRETARRLRRDPSLWVHFDFEHAGGPDWRIPNLGSRSATVPDATLVGCEWREGRWASKPALEFRGVSDRVRVQVPGDLDSVTFAAWVRVQGLDRQINSLFMSDGFLPGTLHWVIRHDGVLGLTAIGARGQHQILASPPVLSLDQFGIWTHLAVVLDGPAREVAHYVNGRRVSRHPLRVPPPFRIGAAELGNWNAHGFPGNDPFLIRNFSGAMDEFCLFARALDSAEIAELHAGGRPQGDALAGPVPASPSATGPLHLVSATPNPHP